MTTGRAQATPLSAWLRVPISWYQSSTFAFFEDESHTSIRRTYTSPLETNAKRCFCGFCGTPLSYWNELPKSDEAEYISLTLGSLNGSDLRDLEELGLLPKEAVEDAAHDQEKIAPFVGKTGDEIEGLPWFDTLVEGSKLGKMRKDRGRRTSLNGKWTVEWEIMEWTADEGEVDNVSPGKRKHAVVEDEDASMVDGQ